jgi:hypothetical protein
MPSPGELPFPSSFLTGSSHSHTARVLASQSLSMRARARAELVPARVGFVCVTAAVLTHAR